MRLHRNLGVVGNKKVRCVFDFVEAISKVCDFLYFLRSAKTMKPLCAITQQKLMKTLDQWCQWRHWSPVRQIQHKNETTKIYRCQVHSIPNWSQCILNGQCKQCSQCDKQITFPSLWAYAEGVHRDTFLTCSIVAITIVDLHDDTKQRQWANDV